MYQWHTPVPLPPLPNNGLFSKMHDSDIVWKLSSDEEDERISEFIDELTAASYVPKRPYKELVELLEPEERMFISHIQAFVFTATFAELRFLGLVQNNKRPLLPTYNRQVPQGSFNLPTLTYGLTGDRYKCCGLPKDHPGCWFGPVKYEITPWVISGPDFSIGHMQPDEIKDSLSVEIKRGAYWKDDPFVKIENLRKGLIDKFMHCKEESDLGLDYYVLLELTHIKSMLDTERDPLVDDFPGKVHYLEILKMKDKIMSAVNNARVWYDDEFIGGDVFWRKKEGLISEFLPSFSKFTHDEVSNRNAELEDILKELSSKYSDFFQFRLVILNSAVSDDSEDDKLVRKMATELERTVDKDIEKKNKVLYAANRLGELGTKYVKEYLRAYEDHVEELTRDWNALRVPREITIVTEDITPYNAEVKTNRFSTGNNFIWKNDSSWCDSVLLALFSISNSPWENEIRKATKMNVQKGCGAQVAFRNALLDDIVYLQSRPGVKPKVSESISYFETCAEKPQKWGLKETANDTFTNLKALFDLSDNVILRDIGDLDPEYTTFAAIMSRPGHFVPYILQPNKKWMILDNNTEESEKVTLAFYLDMKTDLWNEMTKLSAKDVFEHWDNTRDRLGLIQPVYLDDERKKNRNSHPKIHKDIPSHNFKVFGKDDNDTDAILKFIRNLKSGTFDYYSEYPDVGGIGVNSMTMVEPNHYTQSLLEIINCFDVPSIDATDVRRYNKLLNLALRPKYEAQVIFDDKNRPLKLENSKRYAEYAKKDEEMIMEILKSFFKEPDVKGKVFDI